MTISDWTKAASFDDVADGEMLGVEIGRVAVCLAKFDDEIHAINDICTHFRTKLSTGEIYPERREVECPLHDSKFSFLDGKPHQIPADVPVEVYEVKVEEGEVYIRSTEEPNA
ncbi:Rieske 2Fe-2S domain-containing protein [Nocardia sp. R6R-6]|uniref:Rieske 2Fe-2S domain-containing protein n=1 Tax=Nocardia sp. R6R-6 TaxID=3459303 RepID=UPI00403DC8DD